MHSIVIYFSHFGNTRSIAEKTALLTGSDIAEIKPCREYPKDRDILLDMMLDMTERPRRAEFQQLNLPINDYGVIIPAFPIWCESIPGEFRSFIESVDWRGRKVFPLMTYGGIRGRVAVELKEICQGASLGTVCYMRTGYKESSDIYKEDCKRYDEWIHEIKGFLML